MAANPKLSNLTPVGDPSGGGGVNVDGGGSGGGNPFAGSVQDAQALIAQAAEASMQISMSMSKANIKKESGTDSKTLTQ